MTIRANESIINALDDDARDAIAAAVGKEWVREDIDLRRDALRAIRYVFAELYATQAERDILLDECQSLTRRLNVSKGRKMKLAYADPPYPGRAHLYTAHPDYAGEVDHERLIDRLEHHGGYNGWALSTSAEALSDVLEIVDRYVYRPFRLLAWVKHTITVGWEPVIVVSARPPDRSLRDWIQVEPDSYQWRPKPESYVIGQKPEAFCMWLFGWLGAAPTDELDDVFPGSGNVTRAWEKWRMQPGLPMARSVAAEKRAERRARAKDPGVPLLKRGHDA